MSKNKLTKASFTGPRAFLDFVESVGSRQDYMQSWDKEDDTGFLFSKTKKGLTMSTLDGFYQDAVIPNNQTTDTQPSISTSISNGTTSGFGELKDQGVGNSKLDNISPSLSITSISSMSDVGIELQSIGEVDNGPKLVQLDRKIMAKLASAFGETEVECNSLITQTAQMTVTKKTEPDEEPLVHEIDDANYEDFFVWLVKTLKECMQD